MCSSLQTHAALSLPHLSDSQVAVFPLSTSLSPPVLANANAKAVRDITDGRCTLLPAATIYKWNYSGLNYHRSLLCCTEEAMRSCRPAAAQSTTSNSTWAQKVESGRIGLCMFAKTSKGSTTFCLRENQDGGILTVPRFTWMFNIFVSVNNERRQRKMKCRFLFQLLQTSCAIQPIPCVPTEIMCFFFRSLWVESFSAYLCLCLFSGSMKRDVWPWHPSFQLLSV